MFSNSILIGLKDLESQEHSNKISESRLYTVLYSLCHVKRTLSIICDGTWLFFGFYLTVVILVNSFSSLFAQLIKGEEGSFSQTSLKMKLKDLKGQKHIFGKFGKLLLDLPIQLKRFFVELFLLFSIINESYLKTQD
jgi:hypothetical protein